MPTLDTKFEGQGHRSKFTAVVTVMIHITMCRLLRANTVGTTSSEGFSSYLISDYISFCDEKRQRAPTPAKLTTLHGWIKRDVYDWAMSSMATDRHIILLHAAATNTHAYLRRKNTPSAAL